MEPLDKSEEVSGLDKLLDRIPYASGAWRRRLISGVILCGEISLFAIFVLPASFLETAFVGRSLVSRVDPGIVKTSQFLVLLFLVVYAVGAVVDTISDGFVVRGVSVMPGVISRLPLPLKIVAGVLWPFLLIAAIVASSFARTRYELDLANRADADSIGRRFREEMSNDALNFYKNRLHKNVQVGLNEPFGGKAEAAWQALIYLTPEPHKNWTASLYARNHETSSFLSAAFFGTVACTFLYVFGGSRHLVVVFSLYGLLWLISYLFLGYLHIVRRSIASIVEFLAFAEHESPIAAPNLASKPSASDKVSGT